MDKYATIRKEAQESLDRTAGGLGSLGSITDTIKNFWESLAPATRNTITNSLLGAGIGGAASGLYGGMTAGEDESSLSRALKTGLWGGLLSGLTTGAGTAAYNMLSNQNMMPSKSVEPTARNWYDAFTENPYTTAGVAAGAIPSGMLARTALKGGLPGLKDIYPRIKARHGLKGTLLSLAALPAAAGAGYLADKVNADSLASAAIRNPATSIGLGLAATPAIMSGGNMFQDFFEKIPINKATQQPIQLNTFQKLFRSKGAFPRAVLGLGAPIAAWIVGRAIDKKLKGEE